jgi:hypothetical protein
MSAARGFSNQIFAFPLVRCEVQHSGKLPTPRRVMMMMMMMMMMMTSACVTHEVGVECRGG